MADHVGLWVAFATLLQGFGHKRFAAIGTIVRADYELIGDGLHFILENQEILAAGSNNDDYAVAGFLEALGDGVKRGHPDAAADANHGSEILNVRGLPQRSQQVGNLITYVEGGEVLGSFAHDLEDKLDPSLFLVGIRDGEGNTFAEIGVELEDDKLPGFAFARDVRRINPHLVYTLGKLFLFNNLVHA